MLAWYMMSSCVRRLSVCLSVTCLYCVKMAKCRITQTVPCDRPGNLAFWFWCQKSWQNLNGVIHNKGAKCRWGRLKSLSEYTILVVYVELVTSLEVLPFLFISSVLFQISFHQAEMVKEAFEAQRQFLSCVSRCKQPSQQLLESMLKPTSQQISSVQVFILIILISGILTYSAFTLLVGCMEEYSAYKKLSDEVLAVVCIWFSWSHCHHIISCSEWCTFWCWLTQIALKKRPWW